LRNLVGLSQKNCIKNTCEILETTQVKVKKPNSLYKLLGFWYHLKFGLGVVAASFCFFAKDIADDPTQRVSPKVFYSKAPK
jgi:hypothetical protein